jgi:hypothetical protein
MDDSDRAMAISYVLILGWTGLWNEQPSVVLCYGFVFMVLILAMIWLGVAVQNGDT